MAQETTSCNDLKLSSTYSPCSSANVNKRKTPPVSPSSSYDSKWSRLSSPSSVASDGSCRSIFDEEQGIVYASTSRREDLDDLGVYFNDKPLEVIDLFRKIKEQNKRFARNFPDIANKFVGLTKDILKFTVSFEDLNKSTRGDPSVAKPFVLEGNMMIDLDEAGQQFNTFYQQESKRAMTDETYNRLFQRWAMSAIEFIKFTKDVISEMVWKAPVPHEVQDESKTQIEQTTKEPIFTELFRKFSEIFFLSSRICGKSAHPLKGELMSCEADLCYLMRPNTSRGTPTVLKMCEVKRNTNPKPEETMTGTWIEERICSNSMGRIGIELLCESAKSVFSPCVLGIACMQTEIIFMYLEISPDHLEALYYNKPVNDKRAIIHYTKNFDIMKAEDRVQFVDFMFYLGSLQKWNLSRYYVDV